MSIPIRCPSCNFQCIVPQAMIPHYKHCQQCKAPIYTVPGSDPDAQTLSPNQIGTFQSPNQNKAPLQQTAALERSPEASKASGSSQSDFKALLSQDPLYSPHAELVFEDLGELGKGGMGVVRKVRDKRLGRLAALKIMLEEKADKRAQSRFIREAEITATLNHPSIPPVYEAGRAESGSLYLLMKLIDGETLQDRIKDYHEAGRPTDQLRPLLEALSRACEAIAYAHEQGILHRDLKSENIMVGAFGEVLVMDWGLAKDINEKEEVPELTDLSVISELEGQQSGLTLQGSVLGTPGYMSPEQANGSELDERSDLFSLGAILCEILSGEKPVQGNTLIEFIIATISGNIRAPKDILPSVSPELNALTAHALALDKEDRPETVLEFLSEIKAWLQGEPLESYQYSLREKSLRFARKHTGVLLTTMVSLILLFTALLFWNERDQQNRLVAAAKRNQESQRLFNEAKNKARRKLKKEDIQATVTTALTLAERSEEAMLAAAEVYEIAQLDTEQEVILRQCVAKHPPSYRARFQLHLLKIKGFDSQLFVVTDVLKELVKEAEERGDENEFTLYAKARKAHKQGEYEEAIQFYDRIEKYSFGFHQAYLDRGRAWSALKEYKKALTDYDSAISVDPKSSAAFNNRGNVKVDLGDKKSALEDYDQAILLDPKNAFAYNNRGLLKDSFRNFPGALQDFNLALQLLNKDSSKLSIYLNRSSVFLQMGQTKKAMADIDKALKIDPRSYQAQKQRGTVYLQEKNYKQAILEFDQAIIHAPEESEAYLGRGNAYSELKLEEKAIADFGRCLERNPKSWSAYYNRGDSYTVLQQHNKAIADYSSSLLIKANNPKAYTARAGAYLELGERQKALEDYNQALKLDPDYADARHNRGTLYSKLNRINEALVDYSAAIKSDPSHSDAYFNRGLIFLKLKKNGPALKDFNYAVDLGSNDSDYYHMRGRAHFLLGNNSFALNDYNTALKLSPKVSKYYNSRGLLLAKLGDKNGAYADYSMAIRCSKEPYSKAKAFHNRANTFLGKATKSRLRSDFQTAFNDYNEAIKTYPKMAEAYFGRGQIYFELKSFREALKDFNTALSLNFTNTQLTLRRGLSMAELGQNSDAIKELQLYLRVAPKTEVSPLQRQQINDLIKSLQNK